MDQNEIRRAVREFCARNNIDVSPADIEEAADAVEEEYTAANANWLLHMYFADIDYLLEEIKEPGPCANRNQASAANLPILS